MLRSKHSHRFRSSSQSQNSIPSSERNRRNNSSSKKRKHKTCWQLRRPQPRQMPELQYLLESLRMLKKPKQLPQSKKWKDLSRAKRNPQQISNKKETSLKKESHLNPRLTSSKLSMIRKCRWRIRTRKGGSSLKKQKESPCWTQELQQQQQVDPRNNLLVKRRRGMKWSCSQSKRFLRWVSPCPYPSQTKWLHQLSQETIGNHIFSLHQPTSQRVRLFSKTPAQSRDKTLIHQAYMTHQIHLRAKTTDEQATQSTPTTKTKASLSRGNHSFPLKTITRLISQVSRARLVIWITLVRTWIARTRSLSLFLSKIKPRFQLKYPLTSYGLLCSRIKFLWMQILPSKIKLKIKVPIKVQLLMWPSWFRSSNSNQNRTIIINNRSKINNSGHLINKLLILPILIWTMARMQISISFPTNNSLLNMRRPIRCLKGSRSIICKLVKEIITSMDLTTSRIAWQICPICQTSWDSGQWGTQTAPRVAMALALDSCSQIPINWTPCRTCCLQTMGKWTTSSLSLQDSTLIRTSPPITPSTLIWCQLWTIITIKEQWELDFNNKCHNQIKMLCTIKWTFLGQVFHLKVIFKLQDRIIRTTVNNSKWTCTTNTFFNSILTNNNKTNSTPAPSRDFRLRLLELITPKGTNLLRMATTTFILLSRISSISKCSRHSSNNSWRTSKWIQTTHGTSQIKTKTAEHR